MPRTKTNKRAVPVDDNTVQDINARIIKNIDTNFKIVQKYKLTDTHKSLVELGYRDTTKIMYVYGLACTWSI